MLTVPLNWGLCVLTSPPYGSDTLACLRNADLRKRSIQFEELGFSLDPLSCCLPSLLQFLHNGKRRPARDPKAVEGGRLAFSIISKQVFQVSVHLQNCLESFLNNPDWPGSALVIGSTVVLTLVAQGPCGVALISENILVLPWVDPIDFCKWK